MRLRVNTVICIDFILIEEDVGTDSNHISELKVISIFQNIVQILFLACIYHWISEIDAELESLLG